MLIKNKTTEVCTRCTHHQGANFYGGDMPSIIICLNTDKICYKLSKFDPIKPKQKTTQFLFE